MEETDIKNWKEGSIAWMAGNSVAANLLMVFLLVGGFAILTNIKKEVFPEFTTDSVQVTVAYPGSSPEEVEQAVILSVEEAVQGLDGVKEIRSTANEGSGTVTVEAVTGADLQELVDDVKSEVDRITTFPDEAEEPEVRASSRRRNVLNLVIYGDTDRTVLHRLGEMLKDRLREHPDITQVQMSGLPELEISIEVPQEILRRYNLTLSDVANRVSARSVDLPGGDLETHTGEILVRMKERKDYGKQFRNMTLLEPEGGGEVLLGDIARVEDGFEESDQFLSYNGKPAVELEVFRVGDQTPVTVGDAVEDVRKDLDSVLPTGIQTAVMDDSSIMYRRRMDLLLKNGAYGLLIVMLLLGLFLEIRLAFWVMMGIPISFLGSFFLLPPMGVSINMVSMFAYIISLGVVVDDAIIVGENIFSYRQEGYGRLEAAIRGTREVALPVVFAVLTNIAAFMPLFFLPGFMGKVFAIIPVVVGSAFLISLVECLYILPAHIAHIGGGEEEQEKTGGWFAFLGRWKQSFNDGFNRFVRGVYGSFLKKVLRRRYLAFSVVFSLLLVVIAYAASGRMGMSLFPDVESDTADAEVVFPVGTSVRKTSQAARRMERAVQTVVEKTGYEDLVLGILTEVGEGGGHRATIEVQLAGPEIRERTLSTREFARRWQEEIGVITGADYVDFTSSGGPGRGKDITVELQHRRMNVLRSASEELAEEIKTYPMTSEVNDGFQRGKPQFDITMKPTGKALGLSAAMVGQQLRSAFFGARAVRQLRGQNEVDIRVKLPQQERDSLYHLEEFMVHTPSNRFVPLHEVASAKRGRAFVSIDRRKGSRVIQVTSDASPDDKTGEIINDLKQNVLPKLQEKYPGLNYSFEGRQADMRESLSVLRVLFVLALLGIFGLLAVPLRSYVQPAVIVFSVPFGIVGAILGHLVMGYNLSVISVMGIVALSGVVVNDSLILVSFANRFRKEKGVSVTKAIHEAAIRRFRPVLLTSLTTFGGLAPLIFETSRQARFLIPMAISLGFGILFSLVIVLGIVPTLYMTAEDVR